MGQVMCNCLGRTAAATLLALGAPGCEQGNLFIMANFHRIDGDVSENPAAFSCMDVTESSSATTSGAMTDDLWVREETSSSGLNVIVGSFEDVLEARSYDRGFIRAHEVDRFIVTTRGSERHVFTYWGGDSCERCPPAELEVLPGDPSGCGGAEADAGAPAPGANP